MPSSHSEFAERAYLVYGSAQGPEMELARRLLRLRAQVHIVCRQPLDADLEPLRRDPEQILMDVPRLPGLHGVVVAPGAPGIAPKLLDTPDIGLWAQALRVNALEPLGFLRALRATGRLLAGGAIVQLLPQADRGMGTAASAALHHALFQERRELSPEGVRVHFVAGLDVSAPPQIMTGPLLFLLSQGARWMSGSLLTADGGASLRKVPMQ